MPWMLLWDESVSIQCYVVLIPLVAIIAFIYMSWFTLRRSSEQILKSMDVHAEQASLVRVYSYYCVVYREYLLNLLLSCAWFPIAKIFNGNYQSSTSTYPLIVTGIALISLVLCVKMGFLAQFAGLSISPVERSLQRTFISPLRHYAILLKCLMNVIAMLARSEKSDSTKYLQASIALVYILLELIELYRCKPYTNQLKIEASFFAISCATFFVLYDVIVPTKADLLAIVSAPLISDLVRNDKLKANVKIFNKEMMGRDDIEANGKVNNTKTAAAAASARMQMSSGNPLGFLFSSGYSGKNESPLIVLRDIHFRIGLLLAILDQEKFENEQTFLYLSFLQAHKNECTDEYCFCRRRAIIRQWQGPHMLMNQEFLKRYVLKLVQRMGEEFKGIRGKFSAEVVILFSHYVHTLNEFEQPVLALSQLSSMASKTKIDRFFESTFIGLMNHHIKLRMSFANASTKQGDKTAVFTKIVDSFLVSEVKATAMKAKISQLLDAKMKLFQEIVGEKFDSSQVLYEKLNAIAESLMSTETGILELFYNYPSVKQRSAMAFFQAELMNNFKQANNFQHLQVVNEVSKLYAKSHFDFFSPEIIYLVVAYGREKGKIKNASSNAAQFFGYEKEQFEFVRTIEDLIPAGISGIHDVFVSNFFQVGQSGLFRNLGSSLAKMESGFIHPIQLLFDINFLAEDDFSFITFMRKMKTNNVFLVVSESGKIGGISENFYEKIGAPAEINRDVLLKLSQNLNVNNLIPSFSDLISEMKKENAVEAKHFDISLRFIKDLDQFVQSNNDFLNSGKTSELNVKGVALSRKKKKIRKSMKEDNASAAANQATMNFIRKSSFFNEGAADSMKGPSRTSVSQMSVSRLHAGSDPSDQYSQHTYRSGRSQKSFVSRKTIGWKRNRMQKFTTNIVIRIRDFESEDVRMSFKYVVLELEELRKPNENDFFGGSRSDSVTSATMTQRSFMTMRSGKSVGTLVSGSGKFSKGSNDDSEPVRVDSQGDDNGGAGGDQNLRGSRYNLTSTNTLAPIAEEGGEKQKLEAVKNPGLSTSSIFSGKKQLGWVTRIKNLQREREEQERQEELKKAEVARQEQILKEIEMNQRKIQKMIKVKDLATNLPQSSIENDDNNSASASGKPSFISLNSEIAKEKQTIKNSVRTSTNLQMSQRMQQLKDELGQRKMGQFPRKIDIHGQIGQNYQKQMSTTGVGSGIYIEEDVKGQANQRVFSEMDTVQRQRNEATNYNRRINSMTNDAMLGSLRKEPNSNITSALSDAFPSRQLLPYYEIGNHKNYFEQEEQEDIESIMLLESNQFGIDQALKGNMNDSVKQQAKKIKAAAEEKRQLVSKQVDLTASTMVKSNAQMNQQQEQLSELQFSPDTEKLFNISGNRLIDSPLKGVMATGSEHQGSRGAAGDEMQSQQKFFNKAMVLDLDAASQSLQRDANGGIDGGGEGIDDNSSIGSREVDHSIRKADERFYAALERCFALGKDGVERTKANEISSTSKQAIVFDQLNAFLKSDRVPAALQFGFAYWVIGLLLFFGFSIGLLMTIVDKFDIFDETMSLISVQNEVLLPSNFATSFALLNSQGNFVSGTIAESTAAQMIQESIYSSIFNFKEKLNTRINESVTMSLWIGDQVSVKVRSSFDKYIDTTVRLTDLLTMTAGALFGISHDLSQNIDLANRFDGYFSAINSIQLISYFSDFSNEAITQNRDITTNTENIILLVSIPIVIGSIFIYGISFFYLFRYKQLQESFLKFFFHTDKLMLLRDVQRLEYLKLCVNGAENMLARYRFDIVAKDRFLQLEETHHQNLSTNSNKQNKARLPDIQLRHQSIFIFFVLIFVSYMVLIAVTFSYLETYISSYSTLVDRLNGFSKISFKASNLLIHRELCYAEFASSFDASTEIDVDRVRNQFNLDIADLANDIQNLSGYLEDLTGLTFSLIDSTLLESIKAYLNTDFCPDIEFDATFFTQTHSIYNGLCTSAQSGALQQGLVTALNYEKNSFNSQFKATDSFQEFNVRDFNERSQVLLLQEEYISVYLLATEMAAINTRIISMVNEKKDTVTFTLVMIIAIAMVILGGFNIAVFFRGKNQLLRVYRTNKYIVFLIPQLTLLTQPKFFNQFKNLVKNYNL